MMNMSELMSQIGPTFPELQIVPGKTALLLIDMQKAAGAEWLVHEAVKKGISESDARAATADMDRAIKEANANARKILEGFRAAGLDIIHIKIEGKTKNGRDFGKIHRYHDFVIPLGSEWAEFFEEVTPREGEIVLTKTTSGAFQDTNVHRILSDMGIENVIIVGFYTEQCVESTARVAADLGYDVVVIEDATATTTEKLHQHSLEAIRVGYGRIESTAEVLEQLAKVRMT